MNKDALFRGRLNGKDQVPPDRKRSSVFCFEGLYLDHEEDESPRLKTELRTAQRRLLDELYDTEDKLDDTVEGDEMLQVLLRANRPRAGRSQFAAKVHLPILVRGLDNVPPSHRKREEATSNVKVETEQQEENYDERFEETFPSSWLPMAHWVGTLLIGISIVLTWPIGLAYFRG
ncbi:hypothetical protein P3T76_008424 [Phytophthora citrophthora]|uniref:Transmembrane protein n=1 Tax=Phytophthora citrophthora TaxID=4793 RepID=A0AAD9LKX5_9STRA|nr:hypothetical protein P3T76_008424 [Phytophthora citrophthora]